MVDVRGAFKQLAVAETYLSKNGDILVKDSFPICPSFGVCWYTEVDLGFPDVRASSQLNPQFDGTFDETKYTGARSVSIEGIVLQDAYGDIPSTDSWPTEVQWNSASWFCTLLSAWASPARRYRFYFTDEAQRSRFMDVRGDQFSSKTDRAGDGYLSFQLGLVNPSGKIYSFASGVDATPDGRWKKQLAVSAINVTGRAYALTEPRTYPTVAAGGQNEVFYQGTVPNGFTLELYTGSSTLSGPRFAVTDPFGNVQSIGLSTTYAIPAHTTVTFDTTQRTVTGLADGATTPDSLEQYLDAPLQWPQLKPGRNPLSTDDKASKPGYNGFAFTATSSPASDLTIFAKWYDADLH